MRKNSTAVPNVIPFSFEAREVRTLLIDDQPWFVASDVASALLYRDSFNMTRNLDDDERGTQIVSTPSGDQEMTVINQSGLYSAILRSRKAEAKRFKKWVTAEVLPAIRKYGRYQDQRNQMGALVLEAIGVSELTAIKGVIKDKAKQVPKEKRRSFMQVMHQRLRTRFNVPRTELIPHKDFADACNFVAAYSLEGEWLGNDGVGGVQMPGEDIYRVWVLAWHFDQLHTIFNEYQMYNALKAIGSPVGIKMIDHFKDGHIASSMLQRDYAQPIEDYQRERGINQYRMSGARSGAVSPR